MSRVQKLEEENKKAYKDKQEKENAIKKHEEKTSTQQGEIEKYSQSITQQKERIQYLED